MNLELLFNRKNTDLARFADIHGNVGRKRLFYPETLCGKHPHNAEIDVPLNYADYADYYFVEALIRYMRKPLTMATAGCRCYYQ